MISGKQFLQRKRSLSGHDPGRRSLGDGEMTTQLIRSNNGLARENAVLREKCRQLDLKMKSLERIEVDVYLHQVKGLVESLEPMIAELEDFKSKMEGFQVQIRSGMEAVRTAKPLKKTSIAAFCRLSHSDRESHRQAAGTRLQELANTWDLSRITEASNASRSRVSSTSMSGNFNHMSMPDPTPFSYDSAPADLPITNFLDQSIFLSHLSDTSDSEIVDSEQRKQEKEVAGTTVDAAGDQAPIEDFKPSKQKLPQQPGNPVVTKVPGTDELSSLDDAVEEAAKAVKSSKRKPPREPKEPVVRQPRKKKVTAEATASAMVPASGDAIRPVVSVDPTSQTAAYLTDVPSVGEKMNFERKKLRPRRKVTNYKDV